tara:strand:- start:5600 stop:5815 length:216 start_codon:yes stop_codon:yes gene_type:complete
MEKEPNGYEISNLPNGTVSVIPMTEFNSLESVKEYAVKRYKVSDPVVKEIFSWDYDDDHQQNIAMRIEHWF